MYYYRSNDFCIIQLYIILIIYYINYVILSISKELLIGITLGITYINN